MGIVRSVWSYLTHETYRVKLVTQGDLKRYYPQFKVRVIPWWFHFTYGDDIEVNVFEADSWRIIDHRIRHLSIKRSVEKSFIYRKGM